jgi:hypothetical protein
VEKTWGLFLHPTAETGQGKERLAAFFCGKGDRYPKRNNPLIAEFKPKRKTVQNKQHG